VVAEDTVVHGNHPISVRQPCHKDAKVDKTLERVEYTYTHFHKAIEN
jgi:hypothetical protein